MAEWRRRPAKVAEWVEAGRPLPDFAAGHVQAFLRARGVAVDGVSVEADGTIVVATDAATSYQKVYPALDAIDPATLDPTPARRAELRADLDAVLAEIRGRSAQARTPAERAALLLAELRALDAAGAG